MAKKQQQQAVPKTFEEALRELEQILQEIEAGSLGLEESLGKYERGNFLVQHCRGVLNAAEKQIELISGSADGGVTTAAVRTDGRAAGGGDDDGDRDDAVADGARA